MGEPCDAWSRVLGPDYWDRGLLTVFRISFWSQGRGELRRGLAGVSTEKKGRSWEESSELCAFDLTLPHQTWGQSRSRQLYVSVELIVTCEFIAVVSVVVFPLVCLLAEVWGLTRQEGVTIVNEMHIASLLNVLGMRNNKGMMFLSPTLVRMRDI